MKAKRMSGLFKNRIGVLLAVTLALVVATAGAFAVGSPVSAQEDAPDPNQGILVAAVQPDSPADAAGIVRGDIIQAINEEPVDRVPDLMQIMQDVEAGDELALRVLHGDELRTLTVTLGADDESPVLGIVPIGADSMLGAGRQGLPFGGEFQLPDGTAQLPPLEDFMQRMGTPGALIVEVVPGGPADEAGLQAGDVIVAVEGDELTADSELADVIAAYAPGDEITLEIAQSNVITDSEGTDEENGADTETFQVVVTLGENEAGGALLGVRYSPTGALQFSPDMLPFELPFGEPQNRGPQNRGPQNDEPQDSEPLDRENQQVVVMQVAPDSPAAQVGLAVGDVITAVDGEEIRLPQELVDAIAQYEPGDEVTLSVLGADGEEMELVVVLGENEEGSAFLGISIGSMTRSEP